MPDQAVLALDAMGVIYRAADDVAELLIPFVGRSGSRTTPADVEALYLAASLGQISADEFWRRVGVDPDDEDLYLAGHRVNDGLFDAIDSVRDLFGKVCCLSNDVSEWSRKLRTTFGLTTAVDPWIISGDIRIRKPDRGIYEHLLAVLDTRADNVVFVDDRTKNLAAAASLGIKTVLFGEPSRDTPSTTLVARTVADLPRVLRRAAQAAA